MSWKHKSRSAQWGDWHNSSSDEKPSNRQQPRPARSTDEAMWRVAKRVGSTWRWLKLDLALLAKELQHGQILRALEDTLIAVGGQLLPTLGSEPVDPALAARPEVIDLIIILGSLQKRVRSDIHADSQCRFPPATKSVQTSQINKKTTTATQSSGCMVRHGDAMDLSGVWVPLDTSTIRRGCIMKCKSNVSTDTNGTLNLVFNAGHLAKVIDIDEDGDARIAALHDVGISGLWFPSTCYWILQGSFHAFDTWVPSKATGAEAKEIRKIRASRTGADT